MSVQSEKFKHILNKGIGRWKKSSICGREGDQHLLECCILLKDSKLIVLYLTTGDSARQNLENKVADKGQNRKQNKRGPTSAVKSARKAGKGPK